MLVVGRVEVGEVQFGQAAGEFGRVFLADVDFGVEAREDGRGEFDGREDADEGVPASPAELADAFPVLVESLEDARRVGVDGGLGEQGAVDEGLGRFGQAADDAAGGVEVDGVAPRVEDALAGADGVVVLRGVQFGDESGRPFALDARAHALEEGGQPRRLRFGAVGEVAAAEHGGVGFLVVGPERVGVAFEVARDDAGAGEGVEAGESPPAEPRADALHAFADEVQEAALVAEVGDELLGEVVGILFCQLFRHGGSLADRGLKVKDGMRPRPREGTGGAGDAASGAASLTG